MIQTIELPEIENLNFDIKEIPNWWDDSYLFYILAGPLKDSPSDSPKYKKMIGELYSNLLRSKKYKLPAEYYLFLLNIIGRDFFAANRSTPEITVTDNSGKKYNLTSEFFTEYVTHLGWLCTSIYNIKKRFPLGIKGNQILWAELPEEWFTKYEILTFKFFAQVEVLIELSLLLTGDSKQYVFDKLLIPAKENWSNLDDWNDEHLTYFLFNVAQGIGFDGFVTLDEYMYVLSQAFLNQKYNLVEDYPILIRLEDHIEIKEILLQKKQNKLVCRIVTNYFGELIHIQALDELFFIDLLRCYQSKIEQEKEHIYNFAIPALIASIYRDLVTCDEKEIHTRRSSNKSSSRKIDPLEPKLYTTSWQYIPRRQYVYNRPNDDSLMDREPLSEVEQQRQHAIRKWHMVCGHIRRFHNNPDFMAKGEKQDEALADGIILRTGETYVKPHARGVNALDELGEIDINSIPHYMRRKMK